MAYRQEPSEGHHSSLSMFEDYPATEARASKKQRKDIKKTALALFGQSPSSAQAFLASQDKYTNFDPGRLMGKLEARPFEYSKFDPIAGAAYEDLLGRSARPDELAKAQAYAQALNVKDPNAFQALLTQQIALQNPNAIRTAADREWESMYGTMQRDPAGNLQRGMVTFDPSRFSQMLSQTLSGFKTLFG